jgi:2-oxoisovalerate dehydrogenase E2 component (dihydrolipoyl transacylase)
VNAHGATVRRTFPLPDLGEGLAGAEIARWLVRPGDRIEVDQPLVEVETAKTLVQIPCPYAGEVLECHGEVGEELPVGAPLAVIAQPAPGASASAETPTVDHTPPAPAPAPGAPVLVGYGTGGPTGPATGDSGTTGSDTTGAGTPGPVPVVSPQVRRLARDNRVDLEALTGSGPAGLVLRSDVLHAIETHTARMTDDFATELPSEPPADPAGPSAAAPAPHAPPRRQADDGLVLWHGAQRASAAQVTRSHREIPAATCWREADATALLDRCAAAEDSTGPHVGVLALVARMCVAALLRYPALGTRVAYDPHGEAIGTRSRPEIGLGIVTRTDDGTLIPVVRDAGRLTTRQLAAEIARLTAAARGGTLTPRERNGGSFTLNNHGPLGTDGAVPLINHPESAMLGLGRITRRPWVVGESVVARSVAPLSLTFDHRVCDGDTAAGFLATVAQSVEQPDGLLRHP